MKKNRASWTRIDIFRDRVCKDGNIYSGTKLIDSFYVRHLEEVLGELTRRYPERPWHACADGSDGMYENSQGYGWCLVSNISEEK